MSFELSRSYDGTEIIECDIVVWKPNKLFSGKNDTTNEKIVRTAPKNDSYLPEGKWEGQSFLLNPTTGAVRIGKTWILISDIDAASQFTVEKEHAVAFPYEDKRRLTEEQKKNHEKGKTVNVYISGHVGLHLHCESSGQGFTMAFPNFELADVAFDAVNRLAYEQLSQFVFSDETDSDEEESNSNSELQQQDSQIQDSSVQLPKKLKRKNSGIDYKAIAREQKRQKKEEAKRRQQEKADQLNDDEFDENFVAESGVQLLERGKVLNLNEFTTHFLEGGGMGSLTAEQAAEGKGASGPTGPPNNGIIRVRKETGSLSTWIARMETGDEDHVYFLKLSKAFVKAPINRIIRASPPSVAQYFGPVVPLRFDALTVRSESFRSEFILEEVYTNSQGDKRVHRLICVFHSLEERIRWEDWMVSNGVQKKTLDPEVTDKNKKKKGEAEADGEDKDSENKNSVDTTMQLVLECFRLDEVWDRPKALRRSDARARGGKPQMFAKKFQTADGEEIPEYQVDDDDEDFEEAEELGEDDYSDYEDDGVQALPFVADTPRVMENQESYVLNGQNNRLIKPLGGANGENIFDNFSFASSSTTAVGRSRQLAALETSSSMSPGSPALVSPRSNSKKRKGANSSSPGSPRQQQSIQRSQEEIASEQEAATRCPWFAGYQPQKKNKWEELSKTLKKESSAGSGFFNAVKLLRSNSTVSTEDDAGTAHISSADKKPDSPTSSKLSAILRARQLKKAMDFLEEAKRKEAAGEEKTREEQEALDKAKTASPTTQGQMSAVLDLNEVEASADKETTSRQLSQQEFQFPGGNDDSTPMASPITRESSARHGHPQKEEMQQEQQMNLQQQAQSPSLLQQEQSRQRFEQEQKEMVMPLSHDKRSGKMVVGQQQQQQMHQIPSPSSSSTQTYQQEQSPSRSSTQNQQQQQQNVMFATPQQKPSEDSMMRMSSSNNNNTNNNVSSQQNRFDDPHNPYHNNNNNNNNGGVSLFGGPLPSKFPKISLRSEGFVDNNDIQSAMLRRAVVEPSTEGTTLQNSPPNSGRRQYPQSSASMATAHSPAAEESRNFAFGYSADNSNNRNQQNDSRRHTEAPFNSPKNTIMGDFSFSHEQQRGGKRNPDTSSDEEDEVSQRFARARAMRAVSQLGEEFVGVGFSNRNNNNDQNAASSSSFVGSSSPAGRRLIGSGGNSSLLAGHLSPTCPLCGADRQAAAICKKTGRLHATGGGNSSPIGRY